MWWRDCQPLNGNQMKVIRLVSIVLTTVPVAVITGIIAFLKTLYEYPQFAWTYKLTK